MVSNILQENGFFFGKRQEENSESIFHLSLNRFLLETSGATWDNPGGFWWMLDDPTGARDNVLKELIRKNSGWRSVKFWGGGKNSSKFWGWKDPRMSITLPLWLDIYPNAKIIRIIRNGIDVANSLYVREIKKIKNCMNKRRTSFRCLTLEGAFSLWEEYLEFEERNLSSVEKYLEIKYEDLLLNHDYTLSKIGSYLGCELSSIEIDSGRAFGFKDNVDLCDFYKNKLRVSSFLKKYYSSDYLCDCGVVLV